MKIDGLKRKWWAKLLAALLLFMAGSGCLAGMIGVFVCDSYGVYRKTREEIELKLDREMLSKYDVMAMASYVGATDRKLSRNYHYAIFEGSGIEGKVVAGDLAGNVPEDAVIHEFEISDKTDYLLANSMFENAYVQNGFDEQNIEDQILQLYYYVRKDEKKNQIDEKEVSIIEKDQSEAAKGADGGAEKAQIETAEKVDGGTEKSQIKTAEEEDGGAAKDQIEAAKGADGEAEKAQTETAEKADGETTELYLTCPMTAGSILYRVAPTLYRLDEANRMVWLTISTGGEIGVPMSKMEEIDLASSDIMISPNLVSRFFFYDYYEGKIENGRFYAKLDEKRTVYTVAGTVAEERLLAGRWKDADYFEQVQILLDWLYVIRYAAFVLIVVCFGLGLVFFIFLMMAAGHREGAYCDAAPGGVRGDVYLAGGNDAIRLRLIDRVPMDLALCLTLLVCGLCAAGVFEIRNMWTNFTRTALVIGICFAVAYAAALRFCICFAVNVKVGGWWERTVICRIWTLFIRFFKMIWRIIRILFGKLRESVSGVSMGKRVWALFSIFVVCELVGLVAFRDYPRRLMACWIFEKVIFFFAALKFLIDFGKIRCGGAEIAGGNLEYKVETDKMLLDFASVGNSLNTIGDGLLKAVDERIKSERMKTELITNVSHDIKTPLTSIINYTDLLTRLDLKDQAAREYLEVLGRQSARLKKLIEDLIEASKASSGALKLEMEIVNASMMLIQAVGEYDEKFRQKGLDLRVTGDEAELKVRADSRYLFRVFDNLMSNILKYGQEGTRAYIDISDEGDAVSIIFRNISATPLHVSGEELMERFVRGDSSRSTEGSGLGLSIADSLITLMGGTMKIIVDGDLFKVVVMMAKAA